MGPVAAQGAKRTSKSTAHLAPPDHAAPGHSHSQRPVQPDSAVRTEREGEIQVIVHLGVVPMHPVAHLAPGGRPQRHIRPPQRPVPEGRGAQQVVRAQVDRGDDPAGPGPLVEPSEPGDGVVLLGGEQSLHALHPGRRGQRVGIQPGDDFSAGGVVTGGSGLRDAHSRFVHHLGPVVPCYLGGVVGGRVVDHDDLQRWHLLAAQRPQAPLQRRGVVAGGDDDADRRERPVRSGQPRLLTHRCRPTAARTPARAALVPARAALAPSRPAPNRAPRPPGRRWCPPVRPRCGCSRTGDRSTRPPPTAPPATYPHTWWRSRPPTCCVRLIRPGPSAPGAWGGPPRPRSARSPRSARVHRPTSTAHTNAGHWPRLPPATPDSASPAATPAPAAPGPAPTRRAPRRTRPPPPSRRTTPWRAARPERGHR